MVALATAELFQPITGMPRALVAWLCCRPDVRARHRCAGDALLPGKEGYYVRRRAQGGDRGVELLVQTYGKTYGSLPIKNKSEHRFQSNHFQT